MTLETKVCPVDNGLAGIANLKVKQNDDGTFYTEITVKDKNYILNDKLPDDSEIKDTKIILPHFEHGLALLIAWNDYQMAKTKEATYNAQISLITNIDGVENYDGLELRNVKLSNDENQTLTVFASLLANSDPAYFLKPRSKKIDYGKVFDVLIRAKLDELTASGDISLTKTIAEQMGNYVLSKTQDVYDANIKFLQAQDTAINRLLTILLVNTNIFKEALNFIVRDENSGFSQVTKNQIAQLFNEPFPNGTDPYKLMTGNENLISFVNAALKDLYDLDLETLKMKIVPAPKTEFAENESVETEDIEDTDDLPAGAKWASEQHPIDDEDDDVGGGEPDLMDD